jgi:iron(III) transport system permease protein
MTPSGRGRRVSEGLGLAVVLLLAWLVLVPILLVAREAADGAALAEFARRSGEWAALWASLGISIASVVLAAAIGVPLAFLFERFEFPGRRLLGGLVALPVVLPPLVGVVAFLFLYGESGFAARAVRWLLRLDGPPWRLQGPGAILLVHAYSMYVYFYLFTRAGLARLDVSMIEAAHALGAGRWDTLRRVTLPLLRPALVGAALLTFMTALGSFSAPYVFGGGFRVMTTQIVASKLNGEMALAMVETTALALLALAGLWVLRRLEGDDLLVTLGKGVAPARRVVGRPVMAAAAGWIVALLLLLPHLTLVLVSLVPFGSWTTQALPPVLSLENYRRLATEPERLVPLANSVWMAAASTALAVVLALAAGWLAVRRRVAVRRAIEGLLALPWALPGTVFAIALATAFSVHQPPLRWVLVGTAAILPLAYLVRSLPVTGRAVLAGYRQLDPALEEAAASLGAGRWTTLRRVTLPLLAPALAAGASLAFVAALGDFVTSVVLYTYETRPIAIEILSALRLNEIGVAAAFGVVLMVASALVLALGTGRAGAPGAGAMAVPPEAKR